MEFFLFLYWYLIQHPKNLNLTPQTRGLKKVFKKVPLIRLVVSLLSSGFVFSFAAVRKFPPFVTLHSFLPAIFIKPDTRGAHALWMAHLKNRVIHFWTTTALIKAFEGNQASVRSCLVNSALTSTKNRAHSGGGERSGRGPPRLWNTK